MPEHDTPPDETPGEPDPCDESDHDEEEEPPQPCDEETCPTDH